MASTRVRTTWSARKLIFVTAVALLATSCIKMPPTTNFRTTFGSTVYGTWDGGATWFATASTPTYPAASSVVITDMTDGPTRTLIAVGYAIVAGQYHALIWTSPDGGNSWTTVADSPSGSDVHDSFNDVSCTGSTCAALGWRDFDMTNLVDPFGYVEVSTDGGATWMRGLGTIADSALEVAVGPTGTIVVAAHYPVYSTGGGDLGQGKAAMWRSADLGASWNRVYLSPPVPLPGYPDLDIDDSRLYDVVDAGGTFVAIGVIVADNASLLRSIDDGQTWQSSPATFWPLAVTASGTHVVMVNNDSAQLSDDAGATSHPATSPPVTGVYDGGHLRMASATSAVVVVGTHQDGTNVVFTSDDAGNTWAQKTAAQASGKTAPAASVAL